MRYHDYLRLERFSSFEDLVATYDEGVASADAVLGELFQILRDSGLYDEALIVITSDHGESFLDHGRLGSVTGSLSRTTRSACPSSSSFREIAMPGAGSRKWSA